MAYFILVICSFHSTCSRVSFSSFESRALFTLIVHVIYSFSEFNILGSTSILSVVNFIDYSPLHPLLRFILSVMFAFSDKVIMLNGIFYSSVITPFLVLLHISYSPQSLQLEPLTSDYDFNDCVRVDFSPQYPDVWAYCCPLSIRIFVGERPTLVQEGVVYPYEESGAGGSSISSTFFLQPDHILLFVAFVITLLFIA